MFTAEEAGSIAGKARDPNSQQGCLRRIKESAGMGFTNTSFLFDAKDAKILKIYRDLERRGFRVFINADGFPGSKLLEVEWSKR
jgi:hypothetical protein